MKKILTADKKKPENESIIIPDECGDSLWDAVLGQEIKSCRISGPMHSNSLLKEINSGERPSPKDSKTGIQSPV